MSKGYANNAAMSEPEYRCISLFHTTGGGEKTRNGAQGQCRFCAPRRGATFHNVAHTIAEGLGNKAITSNDECDQCNELFSCYDDALCQSVGLLLTVSGVRGKTGGVRQTGRSQGSHNFQFAPNDDGDRVTIDLLNDKNNISMPTGVEFAFDHVGLSELTIPSPAEKFRPRLAYKALAKIGFSILPSAERVNVPSKSFSQTFAGPNTGKIEWRDMPPTD